MKDEDSEIDAAVAAYTAELQAEAELGRAEVGELEDHLRATIGDLREHGLPASHAIAEAARRLGDPRAVARESARVRSPFGAKLSRARAWSIVALMVPLLASAFTNVALMSARDGTWMLIAPAAQVALVAAFVATGGGILRARWSALAAALSAGTLALALVEILELRLRAGGAMFELASYAMIASGALAAAASSVMSWRTAGSRLGSFRALNS